MRKKIVIICLLCIAAIVGAGTAYYKWKYPYGQSHCCIILMAGALEQYADENGGKYPAGEASAEASLSLLYRSNYVDAYTLRGMTVPEKTVQQILQAGKLLGPDSCGWHYVPGLTMADDPDLALLWCKMPLGHNGDRTESGGRQVVFIGKGIEWISGSKWPAFLAEQNELLNHRSTRAIEGRPLVTGLIELPDGTLIDRVDSSYTIREESKGPESSGKGTSSGSGLKPSELSWYQAPIENGSVTRTLSFSNLVSDPAVVTFSNGVANITNLVFKMRSAQ